MYFGLGTTGEGDTTSVDVNEEGMPIFTVTGTGVMPTDGETDTTPQHLNCPGDPGCPGYVTPGSEAYRNSLLEALLAVQVSNAAKLRAQADAPPAKTGTIDATTALLIAGAIVALIFVAKK